MDYLVKIKKKKRKRNEYLNLKKKRKKKKKNKKKIKKIRENKKYITKGHLLGVLVVHFGVGFITFSQKNKNYRQNYRRSDPSPRSKMGSFLVDFLRV